MLRSTRIVRELLVDNLSTAANAFVILVAAGVGRRLGSEERKAWVEIAGRPLWLHALSRLLLVPEVEGAVIVAHRDDVVRTRERLLAESLPQILVVEGGQERADSVALGVAAVPPGSRWVLVHDAARPFPNPERVSALVRVLGTVPAAILAHRSVNTLKQVSPHGRVVCTVDRETIWQASTPQAAEKFTLLAALARATAQDLRFTDEAALLEWHSVPVQIVEDDPQNVKITTPADLARHQPRSPASAALRIGHGYDIHRLVEGRPLVLGGVQVDSPVGLLGHSDGDALLHAIIEGILGAAGSTDIGEHFSDRDPRWSGADSRHLLAVVLDEIQASGLRPLQVDCTIVAERPRLAGSKSAIKASLMTLLGLPADRVAVKARTNEGLDALGRGEALAVHAVVLLTSERTPE